MLATLEHHLGGEVVLQKAFSAGEGKECVGAVFWRAVIPKFEQGGA